MSRSIALTSIAIAALALVACAAQGETTDLSQTNSEAQGDVSPASQPAAGGAKAPSQRSSPRSAASLAQEGGRTMITIPEGTMIEAKLDDDLGSATSHAGDEFTASVTKDIIIAGRRAIPAGSVIHGAVKSAAAAKRGAGNASLKLAFVGIELPDEETVAMSASFADQTKSQKKRNAAIIGGSAAGGALLGRILGKDTKGAVVGALAGGAVGTGVVMSKNGEQVNLPAGSQIALRLEESIEVPHRP